MSMCQLGRVLRFLARAVRAPVLDILKNRTVEQFGALTHEGDPLTHIR